MSDSVANAISGALAGITSMALTYPLITLSTRSQVSKTERQPQLEVFLNILKTEGISGLYSGINSALFGISITQYIYYYWYETVKSHFEGTGVVKKALTVTDNMVTSAVAGALTSILTNPIWVLNTRLMVKDSESASSQSSFEAANKILKEEGIAGFFKGVFPALVLVINPVIQFTVFERLKALLETKRTLNTFDFFILGAISKLLATGITYPYIVVKSRMQLKEKADSESKYSSIYDGFKKIIANEGVKGLYKGIESKLFQSVATSAFTFAFKEEFFSWSIWMLVLLKLRQEKKSIA